MALQLTLSCDLDKSQTGPTLIHSTGVEHYKIPPEVIRTLQENFSNDRLSDHAEGVLCEDAPQRVLDVLRRNGFSLQKQTTGDQKALWTLVQSGGGGSHDGGHQPVPPPAPQPTPSDENEGDAGGEENNEEGGGEGEGEGEEEEEEKEE
ncbi:unnamed protein product [Rotaria magnacalcarata]|uniref:Uncharacterized protein n=4 Tax=Rotaria magnacalcarata TaxID=392030 RepID=A0A816T323_9BILA|nr:unnamed protein product [Rotaria magnacalcarata]CAF1486377.1 unnamed protein product [Rotaria magnacalcarata]CAF2075408.1 unnamed protein product [Rotaria magnacalcarata]CAF2095663.1 unnamed protein product [Rotaria magnacalcarata]CAF2132585.1 unnamed protein product [Rotaria magnacalcarata]